MSIILGALAMIALWVFILSIPALLSDLYRWAESVHITAPKASTLLLPFYLLRYLPAFLLALLLAFVPPVFLPKASSQEPWEDER